MTEHGYAHLILERSMSNTAAKFVPAAGQPAIEQKVTTKIEEQSGEVQDIGWNHIKRVLVLFFTGIGLGAFVLGYEVATARHGQHLESVKDKVTTAMAEWRPRGRTVKVFTIKRKS